MARRRKRTDFFSPRPRRAVGHDRRRYRGFESFAAVATLSLLGIAPPARPQEAPPAGELSAGDPPAVDVELEARRQKLERWTFEPASLEGRTVVLHFDRHDGSFFLQNLRFGTRHFSSWGRRGFASLRLASGDWTAVDRVKDLVIESERLRFVAASSAREVPPVIFELRKGADLDVITLRVEVPDGAPITALRPLDGCLWVADADGGGIAAARGIGEWIDATLDTPGIELVGQPLGAESGLPSAASKDAYTMPVVIVQRAEGPLVVAWEDPRIEARIDRRRPEGDFPGKSGLFVTLEVSLAAGGPRQVELSFAALTRTELGLAGAAKAYAELAASATPAISLRMKTGESPLQRGLLGAALFRPVLADSPRPPRSAGNVRWSCDEIARIAEHWQRDLGIDQAAFLLDGWIGSGAGDPPSPWAAAEECGGREGLRRALRTVQGLGYLAGLYVGAAELRAAATAGGDGAAAWESLLEAARQDPGFAELKDEYAPDIVVLRPPAPVAESPTALARAAEVAKYGREVFGLWGTGSGYATDFASAAYIEGVLGTALAAPASPRLYPLLPAAFGNTARVAAPAGAGLKPSDAAAFLAHLLIGEVPAYELPPHLYFEEATAAGDGPEWCFARKEGWSASTPHNAHDVFIKNTFEVASHVARIRFREPLAHHRLLVPDGSVKETFFGTDMRLIVNFGPKSYHDAPDDVVLPQYGFYLRHPYFQAFYALRAGGLDYDRPALFTVRSLEGKMILRAEACRIFHGLGAPHLRIGGRDFTVEREAEVRFQ